MSSPIAKILPAPLVEFVRGCRYRGFAEHFRFVISGVANRRAFRRRNAGLGPARIALSDKAVFQVDPPVRETFEEFAQGNSEMVDEMTGFLRLAQGCRHFYDIGSLYGAFSLAFTSAEGGTALAFEPNPVSFAVLKRHVQLNPTLKISPFLLGLGDASRSVAVEAGFHFTALGQRSDRDDQTQVGEMQVVSLDDFQAGREAGPDLMKIDVEGFEFFVLQGARATLERFRPRLLIEFHPDLMASHGHTVESVVEFLQALGYRGTTPRFGPLTKAWLQRPGNMRALFVAEKTDPSAANPGPHDRPRTVDR